MTVLVDIPGVGVVEARNAATEATLRSILKTMQGIQKNTGGSGGGGGGGGGAAAGAAGAGKMGNAAFDAGVAIGKFATAVKSTAATVDRLGTSMINTVDSLANMGDSVTGAAGALGGLVSKIPLVGGMMSAAFTAVASAVEHTSKSFQQATASGATFGGSVQRFGNAASAAGMTMDQFAQLVGKNGDSMRLLGGTTEDGARRFADISKGLRTSSKELYNLGYNTQDVNQGLATYTKLTMQGGRGQNMTNAQLMDGTKKYLKELDLLAKVTGESRQEQEERQKALLADAQYQAAMSGLAPEVAESFRNTLGGLPKEMEGVAKDIMATGSATTEESQKFMSMMPDSARLMQDMYAKMQRGEQVSLAERNELNNTIRRESKARQGEYKALGQFSPEFAKFTNMINAGANIQEDGVLQAKKNQNDTQNTTDGMNASLQTTQQQLAEMSNSFQLFLASQGKLIGSMMQLLGQFAGFVQKYLLPIISDYLVPALQMVVKFIVNFVVPTFEWLIQSAIKLGKMLIEFLTPTLHWLGEMTKKYVIPALLEISMFLERNWKPVLAAVGTMIAYTVLPALVSWAAGILAATVSMLAFVAPIALVIAAFVLIDKLMDKFGLKFDMLGDAFDWFGLKMKEIWQDMKMAILKILDYIPGVDKTEAIKELEKEQKATAEAKLETEKKLKASQEKNLTETAKREKAIADAEAKRRKELESGDWKKAFKIPSLEDIAKAGGPKFGDSAFSMPGGGSYGGGPDKSGGATSDSYKGLTGDMSPNELARRQYQRITGGGDTIRKEMEKKAEEKKAADEKAAKEAEEKKKAEDKAYEEEKKKGSPQKSAEALLAELNTKLDANNQLMKDLVRLNDGQLVAVEGLGSDAFRYPRS